MLKLNNKELHSFDSMSAFAALLKHAYPRAGRDGGPCVPCSPCGRGSLCGRGSYGGLGRLPLADFEAWDAPAHGRRLAACEC